VSAVEDGNPWLAADLREAANHQCVEAELILARESAELARDEADRANLAKSPSLATASHDLRQPLQSLSLLNGALRRIVTAPDAADALRQQGQTIGAMSRLLKPVLVQVARHPNRAHNHDHFESVEYESWCTSQETRMLQASTFLEPGSLYTREV